MAIWEDKSSHSRDATDRTPNNWRLKADGIYVSIHHHIYQPGKWHLTCAPWFTSKELKSEDADLAKAEALALVHMMLLRAKDAIDKATGAAP